jgi:predicted nucleotidyltransferase
MIEFARGRWSEKMGDNTKTNAVSNLHLYTDIADVQKQLNTLTEVICKTIPVEQMYLFGSYAYGTPHSDSDIDLYIVFSDDLPMREIDALTAVRIAIDPVQTMPVDIIGLRKNRFLDRAAGHSTLEREVIKNGIKLYG